MKKHFAIGILVGLSVMLVIAAMPTKLNINQFIDGVGTLSVKSGSLQTNNVFEGTQTNRANVEFIEGEMVGYLGANPYFRLKPTTFRFGLNTNLTIDGTGNVSTTGKVSADSATQSSNVVTLAQLQNSLTGVRVVYTNSVTNFVASANTAVARGLALSNALVGLQNSSELQIGPGIYNLLNKDPLAPYTTYYNLVNLTNVTIRGVEGSIIQFTSTGNGITFSNCQNLRFQGVTFIGNLADTVAIRYVGGVVANGPNDQVTFENCRFLNFPNQAIAHTDAGNAELTSRLTVRNCFFQNIGKTNAVYLSTGDGNCVAGLMGDDCIVEGNYVDGCAKGLFEFGYGGETPSAMTLHNRVIIRNNTMTNIDMFGIVIGGVASDKGYENVVIQNNSIYMRATQATPHAPIKVTAKNVVVQDNTIWSQAESFEEACGIWVIGESSRQVETAKVSGNKMYRTGIWVGFQTGSSGVSVLDAQITDNFFYDPYGPAIVEKTWVGAGALRSVVSGNYFSMTNQGVNTIVIASERHSAENTWWGNCTNLVVTENFMGGIPNIASGSVFLWNRDTPTINLTWLNNSSANKTYMATKGITTSQWVFTDPVLFYNSIQLNNLTTDRVMLSGPDKQPTNATMTSANLETLRTGWLGITTNQMFNTNIATTKGDIAVFNGTAWVRLGVGTDTHVLTADAAQSAGVKWAAGGGGGGGGGNITNLFTQIAITTVTNTLSESSLTNVGIGSIYIPANTLTTGSVVRITASGVYWTEGGGSETSFVQKLGGATVATGTAVQENVAVARAWSLETTLTCQTTGVNGTVVAGGPLNFHFDTTVAINDLSKPTPTVINTTIINAIDMTVTSSSETTSILCQQLIFEITHP